MNAVREVRMLEVSAMEEIRKNYINEEDAASVDLLPLLLAVLKRWWIIGWITVLCGLAAFAGTKLLITPTYRANFTAYVNNRAETESEQQTVLSNADLSAARSLTYTYAQIIRSRSVLEMAAEQANLPYNFSQLSGMVSTSIMSNTEIISVYVTSENPSVSKALAEAIAQVSQSQIASIVDGSSMRIIDEPQLPTDIHAPSYGKAAVIGAAIGFLLAVAFVVLREILDDRVKDEESLESRFGVPILGTIPNTASAAKMGGSKYYAYGYGGAKTNGGRN